MPGQVFPPEGFGPCAIAGERLTAAARPRAVSPHHKTFISDLRWMNVGVGSNRSARPPTIRRPEVITIRPTRSADGAVGVTVDTASVLGMELCLSGWGDGVTSRDAMSALQEAGGNAR